MSSIFGQFPKFWRAMKWSQVDPVKMQNAMIALETLSNISATGMAVTIIPGSGIAFAVDPRTPGGGVSGTDIEHVVLVGTPDEDHLFRLMVRKVKFTANFQDGEPFWDWDGESIEATPAFGYTSMDYGQFLWTNLPETPPDEPLRRPNADTTYLKLQTTEDKKLLWYPGAGGMEFCVVRETYEGTSKEILVQVVRNEILVGAAQLISVWPGQFSRDYKAFKWLGTSFSPSTPVLPAFFKDDTWYLMQYIRQVPVKVSGAFVIGGCTPVEKIS